MVCDMTNINNSKLQGQQNRLHAGCNSGGRSWIAKQLHFAAGHSGSDAPPRSVALFARTQPLWKGPAVAGGHLAADRVSPAELIWWLWGAIDCVLTQAHQGPSTRRRWGAGGHCESGEIFKCFFYGWSHCVLKNIYPEWYAASTEILINPLAIFKNFG